jgi:hypothetical protein
MAGQVSHQTRIRSIFSPTSAHAETSIQSIQKESSVFKAAKELGIDTTGKGEEELKKEIARRMI